MEIQKRYAMRKKSIWPILGRNIARRTAQRISDRAINRAAQLLGPVLILADGTLRSLRTIDYGEE
jgi:hypothetical protein